MLSKRRAIFEVIYFAVEQESRSGEHNSLTCQRHRRGTLEPQFRFMRTFLELLSADWSMPRRSC